MSADPTASSPEDGRDGTPAQDPSADEAALPGGASAPTGSDDPSATEQGEPPVLEIPDDLGAVLDSVVAERDQLTHQLAEQTNAYTRLAADFDNYKKRTARTHRDEVARAAGSIVEGLLPVFDGCDAAVQQGVEGVQPIAELLLGALTREGLTRLDPLGDVFDPEVHQAVVSEPAADDADGGMTVVTEVMRPGYLWREQILRPAMVKVQDQ